MPIPMEIDDCYDKVVLWEYTGGVDEYNNPKLSHPVEIDARWVGKRRDVLDAQGNKITIDAVVVVQRLIPVNSQVWLGELSEWTGTASALPDVNEIMTVIKNGVTEDLKGRHQRYTIMVARSRSVPFKVV